MRQQNLNLKESNKYIQYCSWNAKSFKTVKIKEKKLVWLKKTP